MGRPEYAHNDDFWLADIQIDRDEPVFTTGVVCRLLQIPVWVLKQLDAEGIVCPPRKDASKARLYSQRQLNEVKHCWYYLHVKKVKINGLKVILQIEKQGEEGE